MDWILDPNNLRLALTAVIVLVVLVFVVHAAACTDSIRDTVKAILSDTHARNTDEADRLAPLRIGYGRLRIPFTTSMHPKSMRVSVPVGRIPHVRDEATANLLGQQIRDTYQMDGVETRVSRGMRYWTLTR